MKLCVVNQDRTPSSEDLIRRERQSTTGSLSGLTGIGEETQRDAADPCPVPVCIFVKGNVLRGALCGRLCGERVCLGRAYAGAAGRKLASALFERYTFENLAATKIDSSLAVPVANKLAPVARRLPVEGMVGPRCSPGETHPWPTLDKPSMGGLVVERQLG